MQMTAAEWRFIWLMVLPVVAGVGTGDRKSVSQGSRLVEFVSRLDKLWCFVLLGGRPRC